MERMAKTVLTLPCPPNRANDASGWRGRAFGKQRYYRFCAGELIRAKQELKNAGHELPLLKIKWAAHFEVFQHYDADNLAALCKWPIDALKDAGIIKDDSYQNAWPIAWPTQEIKRKKSRNMILEIFIDN